MRETNTIIFNKIKDARTIEENVHLASEYFKNTCEYMYTDESFKLNIVETIEILEIIGEKFDDRAKRPINPKYLEDLCYLIQISPGGGVIINGKVPIKLKKIEYEISLKLFSIFEGIKKYKYNVYAKDEFEKINSEFEAYMVYTDEFDDSDIYDDFLYIEYGIDEYNLSPHDEEYEFSIAEAIDNMYDK